MPELPELTGLAGYLDEQLRGQRLTSSQLASFSALKTTSGLPVLDQHPVVSVTRRGKFLLIAFDGAPILALHLAKAGWIRVGEPRGATPIKPGGPLTARLDFESLRLDITEAGTKKSVAMYLVADPREVPAIATLGPEPLDADYTEERFAALLAGNSGQIKSVLRDQHNIAGIGNAYSDEILHHAKLSPFAISNRLTPSQVHELYHSLTDVLRRAVERTAGKNAAELKDAKRAGMRVHSRAGEACPECGATIAQVSFADRALQYCPGCQTEGKLLADRRMSRLLK